MDFLFLLYLFCFDVFANAEYYSDLQSLQDQVFSVKRVIQQMSTEFRDLRQQHTDLEQKYNAVLDELKTMRYNDAADQIQHPSIQSRSAAVAHHYGKRNVSIQGQKGEKGERGSKGDPGLPGFNGDDGVSGQQGTKGDKGSAGIKGAKGNTGQNGSAGPTGNTGPKGEQGNKGEPGQNDSGTMVAFSVTNLDKTTLERGTPTFLVFHRVDSNVGNDYDPSTGKFICTTPGTYVITWSTEVKENTALRSNLVRNGRTTSVLSVTSPMMSSSSGSQTIILHLDIQDSLYIEAESISTDLAAVVRSTFSGFLLN